MTVRKRIASALLLMSVIIWGTWFGGQLFNEARVIPRWLSAPPASMRAFDAIPVTGGFPFFLLNPFFFLFAAAAAVAAWKWSARSRKWLLLSTAIAFAVSLSLILYLAPLIVSMSVHALSGDLPAAEIAAGVERWKTGNRIRLAFELCGFACSAVALRVWAAEAGLDTPAGNR
jgi:hypothetical protein